MKGQLINEEHKFFWGESGGGGVWRVGEIISSQTQLKVLKFQIMRIPIFAVRKNFQSNMESIFLNEGLSLVFFLLKIIILDNISVCFLNINVFFFKKVKC